MPVKDPTAGFVCYKQEVLETINLDEIRFVGYAFQIEMKFAAWKLGFKIKEVPIIFEDRKLGVSKMNKGIVKEGILGVLKLRWNALFKNYRKRVKNTPVVPNRKSFLPEYGGGRKIIFLCQLHEKGISPVTYCCFSCWFYRSARQADHPQ